MTRINVIAPEKLTDSWLLAEYRELPRISALAKATSAPTEYTLGKGHVKFFYNKGEFLKKRFSAIVNELKRRGFKPNFETYREHPEGLNEDWTPSEAALKENIKRLLEKFDSGQKHKLQGKPIAKEEWLEVLK